MIQSTGSLPLFLKTTKDAVGSTGRNKHFQSESLLKKDLLDSVNRPDRSPTNKKFNLITPIGNKLSRQEFSRLRRRCPPTGIGVPASHYVLLCFVVVWVHVEEPNCSTP